MKYTGSCKQPIKIKQLTLDGRLVRFYKSMKDAEKDGFNQSKISRCVNGWHQKHKGYRWEKA